MATKEDEHKISEEIISSIANDNDFKALGIISKETLTSKTDITSIEMADTPPDIATVRITPAIPALKATSEISIMNASMRQKGQKLLEEIPAVKNFNVEPLYHQKQVYKTVTTSPETSIMTSANASMTSSMIKATLKPSTASVKAEAMMSTVTSTTLPPASNLISEGEQIGKEESFQAYRAMFIAVLCLLAIGFCLCFIS